MTKITIDLVQLIEQAVPQVLGSIEPLLLQQWLSHNAGATLPVTVDLVPLSAENEVETPLPDPARLQHRINDVTTFDDESELRIHVLAPSKNRADLASEAYYELLAAISNI